MEKPIKLTEKYERNGWPSVARPDLKPPDGWSISFITSLERIRNHSLSPDGRNIAFIKYWGNRDDALRLPMNGSISMNFAGLITRTTVSFPHSDDRRGLGAGLVKIR